MSTPITVAHLITLLQQQEPTAQVMVLSDAEGNGVSRLYCVQTGVASPKDEERVYDPEWDAAMCGIAPDEWEAIKADPANRRVYLVPA